MAHVFISYSTRNDAYARQLAEKLRAEGFDVWIDQRRLQSSEDWWRAIVLALRGCDAFVVVLTPDADRSRWVQREITLAEKYDKPMFPLLLKGDIDTPNWELFVRTQVEDVRGGKLPPPQFYDYLAQYAARKAQPGANVTRLNAEDPDDDDVRAEIANVPPASDTTAAAREAAPTSRRGLSLAGLGVLAITLLVVALVAINLFNNGQGTPPTGGDTEATQTAQAIAQAVTVTTAPAPTEISSSPTPTLTSTATASATASLSATEYEMTVQSEIAGIQTESAVTQAAAVMQTAEQATQAFGATADALTETATLWTQTPTPDARQTAQARITETQIALIAQATATADAWTDTPTPTFTPTVTPSPSPTPVPTDTPAPSPTPNGGGTGEILFDARLPDEDDSELFLVNADGSNLRRLTDNQINEINPVWTPDGSLITFVAVEDAQAGIYVMQPDGSNRQQLLTIETEDETYPRWSPQGEMLVFSDFYRETILLARAEWTGNSAVPVRLSSPSVWGDGLYPEFSADGSQISFLILGDVWQVMIADLQDPTPRLLIENAALPRWSPNGQEIVYGDYSNGPPEISVMDADGANRHPITSEPEFDSQPDWSPDGERIAFTSERAGTREVFVMNADGTNVLQLTTLGGICGPPDWRPNGDMVLQSAPVAEATEEATAEVTEPVAEATEEATEEVTEAEATEEATRDRLADAQVIVTSTGNVINVRNGPGTEYSVWTTVSPEQQFEVKGITADGQWLLIGRPITDYGSLWVSAGVVRAVRGSLSSLPVVEPNS